MSHALPYLSWLAGLKVGDQVRVFIGGQAKEVETVTSAPATFVQIGKYAKALRFSRKDGVICGKRGMKHLFRIEPLETLNRAVLLTVQQPADVDSRGCAEVRRLRHDRSTAETGQALKKPLFQALLSQLHPGGIGILAEMQGPDRPPEGTLVRAGIEPESERGTRSS